MELIQAGSGYGSGTDKIVTAMRNNDYAEMPNLTVNYGTALSQIINYDRQFDFSDKDRLGDLALDRSIFASSFAAINDKLAGVPTGKFYEMPLLKSSVVLAINGPVVKAVLKNLKAKGVNISAELATEFKLDSTD
ncbi:UNVERIFIED_CONTAM: hypothetical protein O8I53_07715 [Campylobacter lari]